MRQPLPPASCNVYTPPSLADALVAAVGDTPTARWLEPCVGKGALLEAISRGGTDKKRIIGLDLALTPEPSDRLAHVKRSTEFLDWAARTTSRFDRIIANPPYISLRKLPTKIRNAALLHQTPAGDPVQAGSNCWYAFLCASLRLLRPGGSIGFVLPASFEYAGYASRLRRELPEMFGECRVHRCEVPIFDAVDEGTVVLYCRGLGNAPTSVTRGQHKTLQELVARLGSGPTIDLETKPTKCITSPKHVMLRDVMNIGIGAVTGDSNYFLLSESQRLKHRLPNQLFVQLFRVLDIFKAPQLPGKSGLATGTTMNVCGCSAQAILTWTIHTYEHTWNWSRNRVDAGVTRSKSGIGRLGGAPASLHGHMAF